jgi:lysozyme
MPGTNGVTTTQNFAEPPFTRADIVTRGEAAKALGATSYSITDNGDSFTLEITWPASGGTVGVAAASLAAAAPVAERLAAPLPPAAALPAVGGTPNHALDFAQKIVEHWEGCSLTPYHGSADRADIWTIGWGCISMDGRAVTAATPAITQAQANALLAGALQTTQDSVHGGVTVSLTEYQEAALISFAYNEGAAAFGGSTLLTLLNNGHVTEAAAQFSRWVISNGERVNGLIRRRGAEAAVFLGKVPFGPGLGAALDQFGNAALGTAASNAAIS